MRLYLDTNILVYMLLYKDELQGDVARILYNFENTLLTSSVCAAEMVHLCQIGKIGSKKSPVPPADILSRVRASGIEVQPLTERHLDTLAALPLYDDHRDPNDHLIIAQAIADRVPPGQLRPKIRPIRAPRPRLHLQRKVGYARPSAALLNEAVAVGIEQVAEVSNLHFQRVAHVSIGHEHAVG